MSAYVYHYTAGVYLEAIVDSGALRPSSVGSQNPNELGLVWFSRNSLWEPTATKMVEGAQAGTIGQLTFLQQHAMFGCIRFALRADDVRLLRWDAACKCAGIKSGERRRLERIGRSRGALPSDWLAVAGAVPLSDLCLARFDGRQWIDLPRASGGI